MNDQTTSLPLGNESELDDDSIGASVKVDWAAIRASIGPDDPDDLIGGVVFRSEDYATEEEEDAAYEAFIQRILRGSCEQT